MPELKLVLTPEAEKLLLSNEKRTGLSVQSQIQQGITDYLLKLKEKEVRIDFLASLKEGVLRC